MANEIRVRSAVLAGTITDNPLLVGATSFNSARLADVPAIGATEHYPIVLDPLGVNGAPEVVWITAHTASQTSATITRAREGTTARQHPSGTTWYHGPTVNDYIRSVTTAPSGGGLPFDGQAWYHQSQKRLYLSEAASGVAIAHTTSAGRIGGTWTRSGTLSVSSGGDGTQVTYDAETYDSDGFLTPTSGTATVPAGLGGLYYWSLRFTWASSPTSPGKLIDVAGSRRYTQGGAYTASSLVDGQNGTMLLAAGDTVSFKALHQTGVGINISSTTMDLYLIESFR